MIKTLGLAALLASTATLALAQAKTLEPGQDSGGMILLPKFLGKKMMENAGVDRLDAFYSAIDIVRRGGTISLSGVYGGSADPLPMLTLFDKQITLKMGQANVKRWVPDIMPLLTDDDPLGVDDFATHRLPLADAPRAYEMFQKKQDGCIKVVLKPGA